MAEENNITMVQKQLEGALFKKADHLWDNSFPRNFDCTNKLQLRLSGKNSSLPPGFKPITFCFAPDQESLHLYQIAPIGTQQSG